MDLAGLNRGWRETLRNMQAIAEYLERGQAAMPLAEQTIALANDGTESSLLVFLLGLTPAARGAALGWLIGPQHQSVTVTLAQPLDLVEIRLQERGFTLETDAEGRRDFDSLDAFLEAYARLASDNSEPVLDPVRLGLAAPPPLQNVTILVPSGPEGLLNSIALLGSVSRRGAILAVAAPGDHEWSDLDWQAVNALVPNTLALWPILCEGDRPQAANGWSQLVAVNTIVFPVTRLSAGGCFVPDFVVRGPQQPIRVALTELAIQRRATSVLEMITERYQTDVRQLQSRQKREARTERASDASDKEQDLKLEVDRLKSNIYDDFSKLQQSLRESNRRALMKSGDLAQTLETLLASLHAADLDRQVSGRIIKLTLQGHVLEAFRRRLGKALRTQLDEDCTVIRDGIDLTRQTAEKAMADMGAFTRSFSLVPPDNRTLWEPLEEMLQLDVKYRGELPRRGFLQRLGEGRRVVFVVLMILSLAGSFIGFNVRQAGYAGILFLILFLGTVIYTYRSWRTEETNSLDREIEKVRENVRAEFSRVLNEILREKQARFQLLIDELKRDANAKLDAAARGAQTNRAQTTDTERRDARSKLRVVEQRLKDLQPLGQQLDRLRASLEHWGRDAEAILRELSATARGGLPKP